MQNLTQENRQAILNQVYSHFVVDRQPAGRVSGVHCIYHAYDDQGRRVSCAIGIFDSEGVLGREPQINLSVWALHYDDPGALALVFGSSELAEDDVNFLADVQEIHDGSVKQADPFEEGFNRRFIEQLTQKLDRLACEQRLERPSTRIDPVEQA